jgi:hypothetical protein
MAKEVRTPVSQNTLKFSWRDLKAEATGLGIYALLIPLILIVISMIWIFLFLG